MRRTLRPLSPRWYLLAAVLFSVQVIPTLFIQSPTNDEPSELTNGVFYWKGDVVSLHHHPPLPGLLQALPAMALGLQMPSVDYHGDWLQRAQDFFFTLNRDKFEAVLEAGRMVTWVLGLGLGFLLFLATRQKAPIAGITALGLWALEPNLVAFSGLAVADLPVTFFFLAAVMAFHRHLEKPGRPAALGAGLLAALAVTCKFSALVLPPLFLFLEWDHRRQGGGKKKEIPWGDWAWGSGAFLAWVFLLYLPGTLFDPAHRNPFAYCLGGLEDMVAYGQTHHHPSYFWGVASRQNHWLYYPAAFLLKSALPFLILLAVGGFLALRGNFKAPAWAWAPPLAVFLSILPVQNLGVRYLLPAYPFLILLAAFAAEKMVERLGVGKLILGGLLLWQAASVLFAGYDHLSYFNDLVPPDKKILLLGDSNLDWGQDVKRLAETGKKRGWNRVRLACLAGVDPDLYGLAWEPWTEKDLSGPQPGRVYAVDAALLQLGPVFYPDLKPLAQSWVVNLPPTGQVGDSWYFFEIPGKAGEDLSAPIPHAQGFRNHVPEASPP